MIDELALHEKAMRIGSASLAKAIYVARTGRGPGMSRELIWSRMGLTPRPGLTMQRDHADAAAHRQRKAQIEALKAPREPCSFCGVRSDFGCKHRRAA